MTSQTTTFFSRLRPLPKKSDMPPGLDLFSWPFDRTLLFGWGGGSVGARRCTSEVIFNSGVGMAAPHA